MSVDTHLTLLAPFRIPFALRTGVLVHLDHDYASFWSNVQTRVTSELGTVDCRHRAETLGLDAVEYAVIHDDPARHSAEVLRFTDLIDDPRLDELWHDTGDETHQVDEVLDGTVDPDPSSLRIHLYDDTIGILVVRLQLQPQSWTTDLPQLLDRLQARAIAFAHRTLGEIVPAVVLPYVDQVAAFQEQSWRKRRQVLIDPADPLPYEDATRSRQNVRPMWVARLLTLPPGKSAHEATIIRHWLRDLDPTKTQSILDGHLTWSLQWLNYLHRPVADKSDLPVSFDVAWELMRRAQYIYAAVQALNDNLDSVIADAHSVLGRRDVRRLDRRLRDLVARTELLLVAHQERQKYLSREKLSVFRSILDTWEFGDITATTEKKNALCAAQVEHLHRHSLQRNAVVVDFLLMVIGTLSLIGLAVDLSQYGRTLATSATLGLRDEGQLGILAHISELSTDLLLGATGLVIIVVGFLYVRLRFKRML